MKTELESAEILSVFEDESDAYAYLVRGVSVWRLLRAPIGYALQDLPLAVPQRGFFSLFFATVRSLKSILRWRSQEIRYVVKSYTSALCVRGQPGSKDMYFEELLDQVPGGVRLVSANIPAKKMSITHARPSLDCTAIHIFGALLAYIAPLREGNEMYTRLAREIELLLGVKDFSAKRIRRIFSSFWWQSRLFERLLNKLSPQTVIISDSGERAMIAACRRCGVHLIELQHGVFTKNDPDCLPANVLIRADEAALLLPDVLALHGEYWVSRHHDTAMGRLARLRPVGSAAIDWYRAERERRSYSRLDCLDLVLTTQGLARDSLIRFLTIFLAGTLQPFRLSIKLHPVFDTSAEPYVTAFRADSRVRVLPWDHSQNTYQLLVDADLHLSIASASHFDAIALGCPTVILNLAGSDVVEDVVSSGHALYAETPLDLIAIVDGREWIKLEQNSSEMFFRSGFVANMSELIQ
jgi:hypothetical protein